MEGRSELMKLQNKKKEDQNLKKEGQNLRKENLNLKAISDEEISQTQHRIITEFPILKCSIADWSQA